ncbi:hydroxymethylglutaryl-CoA synthase [Leucobacter ruminantium]|uniref:Hydroxymethylglutaryl-CoA synthase n=1 Tax=Leucobacter ruminantium TaxID=1289170 RepID=A0A939LYW4_9MICO|nr:hydroxymethylglutaryl-CoA synthase [Leucobacter ruminantium]MBO1805653.1 hydroxymethylglutaryl-CoA synthase [Leucobacter ruminantium]
MTRIGIHDLELATAHHVLDLDRLAESNGIDPNKFRLGLGQDEMSVPAPDEDIVTMGASAALPIIERNGMDGIRTLLFATESGVDQSKAAGVSVQRLVGLPPQVRVVEFKQACYGGTAALQAAVGIVSRFPEERVLVIASDVARYELDSPGEPTQGAGAVAMLVSADPSLLEIEPAAGLFTDEVDDFWRPNDSSTAVVDGALSVTAYLDALAGSWDDLQSRGGPGIADIDRILYHQPFTKMAKKAQAHLAQHTGAALSTALTEGEAAEAEGRDTGLAASSLYNRRLGNSYTASVYAALAALLDHDSELEGRRIGLFSYGSGSVSEFITGIVQPGYETRGHADRVSRALDARVPLDVPAYRELHSTVYPSAVDVETPRVTNAPFRFAGISGRARRYERTV